jgi:proton-coupled amino acid transporter
MQGCLSLPYAFSHVGYYIGVPLILLLASFTLLGWIMLLRCKQRLVGNLPLSYGDVTERVFGPIGRSTVNFFVMLTQLGICSVYFSFIASNMQAVLPDGLVIASLHYLVLLQLPLMLAFCSITDLRHITPLSMAANLFFFIGLCIVFGYDGHNIELATPDKPKSSFSFQGVAIFFGTAIFSFEGIGLVLPIENEMANPQHYPTILTIAIVIIATVFACAGEFTLIAFGTVTKGSATAEIALDYKNDWEVVLCNVSLVIAVAFTFPIQFFPAIQIAEANCLKIGVTGANDPLAAADGNSSSGGDSVDSGAARAKKRTLTTPTTNSHTRSLLAASFTEGAPESPRESTALVKDAAKGREASRVFRLRMLLRWCMVSCCALFAYAVPNLGLLISLLGSVGSTVLALLLPAMLYWRLMRPSIVVRCGLAVLLFFGAACGTMSFVVATMELVKYMKGN